MSGETPQAPVEPVDESPPQEAKKRRGPMTVVGMFGALARRPLLIIAGTVGCALAALLDGVLGESSDPFFNLMSYVPFLGGAWAVWAAEHSTAETSRGHLPGRARILAYASTAVVLVVLSGLAGVTLTVLGKYAVKTALALGPTVALAEASWPHLALWRGLMVIDAFPRDFLKVAGASIAILLVTVLALPFVISEVLGAPSGGVFIRGAAQGLGWAAISGVWMRFYLRVRSHVG